MAKEKEDDPGDTPVGERFVVILRHGVAEPKTDEMPDRERTLTEEGRKAMKKASKGLLEIFPYPDALFASPYVRCVETALKVSKAYQGAVTVRTSELLTPDATPNDFLTLVQATTFHRMIVVGHEPNLTAGMLALTGISGGGFELEKGGCYGVRIEREKGQLVWMLTNRMLRKFA